MQYGKRIDGGGPVNIAIDIDDTLTDTFEYLMPFVAEFYEKDLEELQRNNISYSNIPTEWRKYEWDFEKSYYDKVVAETPFKKGAAKYVSLLRQMGHRIVIITGRTKEFYTDPYATTIEELNNGSVVYDKLICTLDKNQACLDEHIDVMIDDLISNCDSVSSAGITSVLFTSQANRYLNTEYVRVNQWDDVVEILEYIERGYPDRTIANELLRNAEKVNPGPWGNHSRTVAHCAEKIALACGDMDSEKAYVLGLLHDIGRRFGVRHLGHVSDGYTYMKKLGYKEAARICLTHSFQNQSTDEFIGKFDTSEEERKLIETELEQVIMDDYDRLIQLCDALAGSEGVLDIEERMNDVKARYGAYPQSKWDANIGLKSYFERKTGRDIYDVVEKERFRPWKVTKSRMGRKRDCESRGDVL